MVRWAADGRDRGTTAFSRRRLRIAVALAALLALAFLFLPVVQTHHTAVVSVESEADQPQRWNLHISDGDRTVASTSTQLAPGETAEIGRVVGTDEYVVGGEGSEGATCSESGRIAPGSGGVDLSLAGRGYDCDFQYERGETVTELNLWVVSYRLG